MGANDLFFQPRFGMVTLSGHTVALQAFGSFVDTALESGNSEKIIRERYYNTLTIREDALKIWQVYPKADISIFTDGEKEFVHEMLKN